MADLNTRVDEIEKIIKKWKWKVNVILIFVSVIGVSTILGALKVIFFPPKPSSELVKEQILEIHKKDPSIFNVLSWNPEYLIEHESDKKYRSVLTNPLLIDSVFKDHNENVRMKWKSRSTYNDYETESNRKTDFSILNKAKLLNFKQPGYYVLFQIQLIGEYIPGDVFFEFDRINLDSLEDNSTWTYLFTNNTTNFPFGEARIKSFATSITEEWIITMNIIHDSQNYKITKNIKIER